MERVRRFHFDRYDSNIEEWPYYIRRFETELALYELRGDDTMQQRRNLLLSRIGPDAYKIVVDHFRPEEVETRDYDEVKQVLHRYYAKNICITAERVVFSQRHRKDSETVTQFINALRALAGHCEFGASLDERLRDQLIIGVANDTWQKEIFRLHPTNASTLAQVEATVLVLEQASQQQQRLHGLAKHAATAAHDTTTRRVTPHAGGHTASASGSDRKQQPRQPRTLQRGKHCLTCGNNTHLAGEKCPAESVTCSACGTRSHYARVCVKAGNAVVATSSHDTDKNTSSFGNKGRRNPKQKQVHNVTADTDIQSDYAATDESDNYNDFNVIYAVQKSGTLAVLYAKLNGHKTRMLYDPGAAYSVIG
jgi:hypothetical protein